MTKIEVEKTTIASEAQPIAHIAIHETIERIFKSLPVGTVLDVPAGEGALAKRLQKCGFTVSCCDLYPQIFRLNDIEIKRGNLDMTLPYPDDSFDYAICVEGLEHIENPANAVRELGRIVKNNGQIIISVPNIMNIEERLKWLFYGYTSHFKPLSQPVLQSIKDEFGSMSEIALHINPIGYSELRFLLEKYDFKLKNVYRDKPKNNLWLYYPVVAAIRFFNFFVSNQKRQMRWTNELNSNEIMFGGNTLIVHAVLEK